MTTQEKLIKLASMMPQIEKIDIPAYLPMGKELKQVKEAMQLIMSILTEQEGAP